MQGSNLRHLPCEGEIHSPRKLGVPSGAGTSPGSSYIGTDFTRLDEASHPDHALFQQAYAGVKELDAEHGRAPDQHSKNLAGALTVEAKAHGLKQIDIVALSDDGSKAFAAQHAVLGKLTNVVNVDTVKAVHSSIEQSTQQMAQVNQTLLQNQQQTQQMAQQVSQQAPVMQSGPRMG